LNDHPLVARRTSSQSGYSTAYGGGRGHTGSVVEDDHGNPRKETHNLAKQVFAKKFRALHDYRMNMGRHFAVVDSG